MPQTLTLRKLKLNGSNEDLQEISELTPKKDVLFIIGDSKAKVGGQEIPRIIGKIILGIQNKAGQKQFC